MRPARPLDEAAMMMCVWCGPLFMVLMGSGLMIAHQLPVLSPNMTPEQLALFYRTHTNAIRTGILISFVSTALYLPFTAVISTQIRRMEGSTPILAYAQFAGGMGTIVALLFTMSLLIVAAFRPERAPEITQALHDMSWITNVITLNTYCIQYACIARATIKDNEYSDDPIFPRWIIYINYITGLSFVVDVMLAFYKTGPFAWNGLLALYVPFTCFGAWFICMAYVLTKAVRKQAREERALYGAYPTPDNALNGGLKHAGS
jgi:cellulose synthase/poly-beta-1,6-N-acetylglucosamine synthase-like glycosyltransferase